MRKCRIKGWLLGLGLLAFVVPSFGETMPDLRSIVHDTQIMSREPDNMTLVWWIPEQFWAASMKKNPNVSQEQVDQFLHVVHPYVMVAAVEGRIGAMGGVTYVSEADLRSHISIQDAVGERFGPLDESTIDPDMKNLLMMIRPVIVNMLGPLGQNMHFYLFPAKDKNGDTVADPVGSGFFHVLVSGEDYKYRLPLGSFLPPRFDAATGEKFPGNYNFNPYTGNRLVARKPD